MANADFRYGLRPVEHLNGNPWNGATRRCRITSNAGDLGVGDAVYMNGSGSGGYPEVVASSIGAGSTNAYTIFGVVTAFEPVETNLERIYIASADSGWAAVCVDPDVLYSIQANGVVGSNDIGQTFELVADHTIDTVTGLSGTEMAASTGAADATQPLLCLGGVVKEDNDLTLTHAEWIVMINKHQLRAVDADTAESFVGVIGI